jgi:hypothetical protein
MVEAHKLKKSSVRYRESSGKRSCGSCSMYRANRTCTLVTGSINPNDVCDRWQAKEAKR